MRMASTDDVYGVVNMLLDALVRTPPDGITENMGQVGTFPGLVPRTHRAAQRVENASAETLRVVSATANLLDAVNVQTLGRIETEIKDIEQTVGRAETAINDGRASNDQALGRIEAVLKDVMQFLPTVRADMTDLAARLDAIVAEQQQGMAALNVKLDAAKAEIQALPH
jgi:hypothetical protein